jgi:hypothetical protein
LEMTVYDRKTFLKKIDYNKDYKKY